MNKTIITAVLCMASFTVANSQDMNNPNTNTSLAPTEHLQLT